MLVVCEHCSKQLNLPDEKIPDRPFAIKCSHCKQRLEIDPANPPGPAAAPPPAAPPPAAAAPPPAAAAPAAVAQTGAVPAVQATGSQPAVVAPWDGQFRALPAMHGTEKQIFNRLYPVAGTVNLGTGDAPWMQGALAHLGLSDFESYASLEETVEKLSEIELGVLLIRVDKASLPPFEPLKPLYQLPLNIRRKTFVALLADNLRSLDGQLAFFLQVNCLINAREIAKIPVVLRRAILFHLKHYQHWPEGNE